MKYHGNNGIGSPRHAAGPHFGIPHWFVLACLLLVACQPVEPAEASLETVSEPEIPVVPQPGSQVFLGASRRLSESAGEDWPNFLGPRFDGTSIEAGPARIMARGGATGSVVALPGGVLQRPRDQPGTPDPAPPSGK